jgi:hypothetical protein
MDLEKAGLVVCITVAVVVLINVGLISLARRGRLADDIKRTIAAANRGNSAWRQDDETMTELSRRVNELKQQEEKKNDHE